jgi:hypothetical protein
MVHCGVFNNVESEKFSEKIFGTLRSDSTCLREVSPHNRLPLNLKPFER